MTKRFFLIASLCVVMLGSVASAEDYYFYSVGSDNFGEAFRSARDAQILNPQADMNMEPVRGVDGETAEIIMGAYRESFQKKQGGSGATNLINIGGIGAASGSK